MHGEDRDIGRVFEDVSLGTVNRIDVGPVVSTIPQYRAIYTYSDIVSGHGTGRLSRVTGPGLPTGGTVNGAYYSYVADSDLLYQAKIKDNGTVKLQTTKAYESDRDLLASIENRYAPDGVNTLISKYAYQNDNLNLRTQVSYSGTAFGSPSPDIDQSFGYNPRNELTSSTLEDSPDQDWTYDYDPIGNRVAASQPAGIEEEYTSNWLNQSANLFSDTSPATGQGFRYDADGNLTDVFVAGDMNP